MKTYLPCLKEQAYLVTKGQLPQPQELSYTAGTTLCSHGIEVSVKDRESWKQWVILFSCLYAVLVNELFMKVH